MKKLGDILNLQNIPEEISEQEKKSDKLKESWQSAIGIECAEHTSDISFKNGTLYITMENKVWQQELLLTGKNEIIEKMKQATGKNIIDIKIKAGG